MDRSIDRQTDVERQIVDRQIDTQLSISRDLRRRGRPREAELTGDLGGGGLDALRQLRAPLHEAVALGLGSREEHLVGGR